MMAFWAQIEKLGQSLLGLGAKRLIALGLIGAAVFAFVGIASYYLSRPNMEVLYAGLDRDDIGRIGSALKEAGITYDISADGTSILGRYGESAQARMLLAEKGLPHGANAGYELFDKVGSLGLTSFMQEVTRVRVLEGELSRTIQLISGVKAARVHIVLPDEGSFRRTPQPPSASVIIRTTASSPNEIAATIRHLVAAAVPGMTTDQITVLSTDGHVLASGADATEGTVASMLNLEHNLTQDVQDKVTRTLAPYLGAKNLQVSVSTRINTDKKQTNETIYSPESRVERSTRVIKETQTAQNSNASASTSIDKNLVQEKTSPSDGKNSNEENQKREEITNYELSSKTISTVSNGYSVQSLSVAILINRAALVAALGDKATPDAIDKRLNELEQLVVSAAGLQKDHGDAIKITAVDFTDAAQDLAPVAPPTLFELMLRQSGSLINALALIVVAFILIRFGLRPAMDAILANQPQIAAEESGGELPMLDGLPPLGLMGGDSDEPGGFMPGLPTTFQGEDEPSLIEDLIQKPRRSPQKRLEQMVQFDEEQAAAILKQWIARGKAA
jgi:flagellar M-ring protein FliF